VLASTALSIFVGATATVITGCIATFIALAYVRFPANCIFDGATALADTIDSVPQVLWILAVVVAVDEPRRLIAPLVFVLLSTPGAVRLFIGECRRQASLPYVLAARAIGVGSNRLLLRHIVPNGLATLVPFFLQIFGGALAIDGAIGILGVGNRTDLNLGTLLLRGKEQVLISPWLLSLCVLAYLAVFSTLFLVENRLGKPPRASRGLA